MDRHVVVRYYEIEHPNDGSPLFEGILRDIAKRPVSEREASVDDGAIILRLENLSESNDLLVGDLTRVQSRNLPGHVSSTGVDRLPVEKIGHSAAFLFDPETGCLALQFDQSMGVSRFCRYLRAFSNGADFRRLPYLKPDTLTRFRGQTPTRLRLKVAKTRNFQHVREHTSDFEEQFEHWSQQFDAPSIELVLSTRGEGKSLDSAQVWNTIRRWIGFKGEIEGIKKIEAETIESDKAFNFLQDLLYDESTLDLPDNDPEGSRTVRTEFVRTCYDRHRNFFRGAAGVT